MTLQDSQGLIVSKAVFIDVEISSAPSLFVLNKLSAILFAVFGPTPGRIFNALIKASIFSLIFIFWLHSLFRHLILLLSF